MSKIRFNLLAPAKPETHLLLVFRYDGQTLRYYTGYTVKPRLWNGEARRFRKSPELPNAPLMNDGLALLEKEAEAIYLKFRNEGRMLTPDVFRAELDAIWKGRTRPVEHPVTFWQFVERFIADRAAAGSCTNSTIGTYKRLKSTLKRFESDTRTALDWFRFDRGFSQDFTAWMNQRGMRANYTRKILSMLKVVLREADGQGFPVPPAYRDQKFYNGVKAESAFSVALDVDELAALAQLNLADRPRLADVRDLFLFGAFTGLRFSDYSNADEANIKTIEGQKVLQFTAQKTRKRQIVPLAADALAILDKRGGMLPRVRSNQEMNRVLKELAELAGITEMVEITETKGGFLVRKSVAKSELIATHTARRSFATNAYLRLTKEGRSIEPLVKILGHSTEAQTRKYIKNDGLTVILDFAKSRLVKVG